MESRDFGSSYLLTAKSDRDEVSTKLVALVEIFPTTYHTLNSEVGKRSIPDF
jgi:hypothetical protein